MRDFVGALDQGTSSTRFIVFDHEGNEVARHQVEHDQILPRPGWVEHDPVQILERAHTVIRAALSNARLSAGDLAAIGLTNQRETTVVWDRKTGRPYLNAIVWQDTRNDRVVARLAETAGGELVRRRTGLPPATYFSAGKLQWILENSGTVRRAAQDGTASFGTVDSWLVWNLTGGTNGGKHVTDVTNASRTMLMDLSTLAWDDELLALFGVPAEMLPEIWPSSAHFGEVAIEGRGRGSVPLTAALGDQHAAMLGQVCLRPGEAKNTYGTGNFLLLNTGAEITTSKCGLLSTVCYQVEGAAPVYALEGSIAVTGAAVQWLRDQLGVIASAPESEALAAGVEDTGGVYFVPAFSGLFAPYWRSDARGAIVGLTRASSKAHLARATLEAICYQTRDVLLAMEQDLGVHLSELKVDGGITANKLCMQMQADILGLPVSKPVVAETTALGAAYAAGLAVGYWSGEDDLRRNWREAQRWEPGWDEDRRQTAYAGWQKAVARAMEWVEPGSGQ
ncbi:MAG TPA: glycerol kinase GlpK [Acidimicrobiales bacterium]|nr:glycerol kinase GlpK [Acidimicrobiales bacterium]